MTSVSSGYDLSVATFSPDGRVFQVEYACKALENSGACMGAVFQDGVLLAVNKQLSTKLLVPGSASRIFIIDKHIICAVAGLLADARQLVNRCREEALEYRSVYGIPIPGHVLAERIGLFVHAYTAVWSVRPFGCGLLLGIVQPDVIQPFPGSSAPVYVGDDTPMEESSDLKRFIGPSKMSLYSVDPSGTTCKYHGCALAKGASTAKGEIEKLDLENTTCATGMFTFVKSIRDIYAETSSPAKIEMIWLKKNETTGEFEASVVPDSMIEETEKAVEEYIRQQDME